MLRKLIISSLSLAASTVGFSLFVLTTTPSYACDSAFYDHNGSIMEVHVCDGQMTIEYDKPRSSLRKHGVRPGTVLFRGEVYSVTGAGKINGQANVFLKGCGSKSYEVNGWMEGNTITMAGQAPVRGSNCKINKFRSDKLIFTGL